MKQAEHEPFGSTGTPGRHLDGGICVGHGLAAAVSAAPTEGEHGGKGATDHESDPRRSDVRAMLTGFHFDLSIP
jgi:hypothetical protein